MIEQLLTIEQQAIADSIKSLVEILPTIVKLENQLDSSSRDLKFMADTTFVTRKSVEILEVVKKQLNKLEEKIAERACLTMAQFKLPNYSTENCTVTPNSDFYIPYPASPEKEGYDAFVNQLPLHCMIPHFPAIVDEIAKSMEDGGQLPFGFQKETIKGITFKLRLRAKREL